MLWKILMWLARLLAWPPPIRVQKRDRERTACQQQGNRRGLRQTRQRIGLCDDWRPPDRCALPAAAGRVLTLAAQIDSHMDCPGSPLERPVRRSQPRNHRHANDDGMPERLAADGGVGSPQAKRGIRQLETMGGEVRAPGRSNVGAVPRGLECSASLRLPRGRVREQGRPTLPHGG